MEYPLHSLFVLAPVKVCRTCNLNTQQSEICLKPQKKSLIKRQWRLKTENLQDLSSTLAKRTDVLKFQSFHRKVCDSGKHKFINYARFFYYRDQKMHYIYKSIYHHHHKHQGFDPLIRSVSTVTDARANASSVFQLFSFLAVCSCMISKGFGFVAFFASVKTSSVCIHLSCLVCL